MWASEVLEAPVGQYALPKVDLSAVMIFSEASLLNLRSSSRNLERSYVDPTVGKCPFYITKNRYIGCKH